MKSRTTILVKLQRPLTTFTLNNLTPLTLCLLGNFSYFFVVCLYVQNQLFQKILLGIPSVCQTVWNQISPDKMSGLIWVQTVCKVYQQTTLVGKEFNCSDRMANSVNPDQTAP